MIYKVAGVVGTEDAGWQGLHRTYFNANNQTMYALHQPGNAPKVGDELDGTVAPDKRQNLKFTKTKTFSPGAPSGASTAPRPSQEKVFKADPTKLHQDFTLEVARNQSIQRQVALKCVTDLMVAGRISTDDLDEWFNLLMDKLANQWAMTRTEQEATSAVPNFDDVELPPAELYDDIT